MAEALGPNVTTISSLLLNDSYKNENVKPSSVSHNMNQILALEVEENFNLQKIINN